MPTHCNHKSRAQASAMSDEAIKASQLAGSTALPSQNKLEELSGDEGEEWEEVEVEEEAPEAPEHSDEVEVKLEVKEEEPTEANASEDLLAQIRCEVQEILSRLRSGGFREKACELQHHIGIKDFTQLHPSRALTQFSELYCCTNKHEFSFTVHTRDLGYSATLTFPAFYNRSYNGKSKRTVEGAKVSAAEAFQGNASVVHTAALLPPSQKIIRKYAAAALKKFQRKILEEELGEDGKSIEKEIGHEIFMGFQELGCRTALWDRNV